MQIRQYSPTGPDEYEKIQPGFDPHVFTRYVSPGYTDREGIVRYLGERFPEVIRVGCSTSGEIHGDSVSEDTVSLTVIRLSHTTTRMVSVPLRDASSSFGAGKALVDRLDCEGLRHVCVGRRLVFKQLVEEDVEAVRDVVGQHAEFSPCLLHNQTMTVTTCSEEEE